MGGLKSIQLVDGSEGWPSGRGAEIARSAGLISNLFCSCSDDFVTSRRVRKMGRKYLFYQY